MSTGLPPVLCLKHIFDHWIEDWFPARIWSHLKVYFYISDYGEWRPLSEHLLPDLILLIVLAIQEKNFLLEQRQASVEQMGNNVDHQSQSYRPHLLHDFLTNATLSWANRLASLFYSYVYWLIIIYLYIVATYRQSLFYFLLLLACFYFLWEGQAFLQRPFQQQKSLWHLLLLSLFSIFIAQLFMQWVSCILIHYTTLAQRCMLMNFLGTSCSIRRFQQLYATDCLVHQLPQKISGRVSH